MSSKQCLKTLNGHNNSVTHVINLTTNLIVTGSNDSLLKIWNVCDGVCVRTIENTGLSEKKFQCFVKLDENHVISGDKEGNLTQWNTDTGLINDFYSNKLNSTNSY